MDVILLHFKESDTDAVFALTLTIVKNVKLKNHMPIHSSKLEDQSNLLIILSALIQINQIHRDNLNPNNPKLTKRMLRKR